MFKISLFDLNYDYEEENAVLEVLRNKWISTGPKTQELETLFAKMLNIKYALATSNCTTALHLALLLIGIKPGDEVICPSLTFVATANAIKYVNANPVFCDITSLDDLTISSDDIEKSITSKTKAIVVMHFAGFPCNMTNIMTIAKKHNLKVIEDACHGPLSEYKGQRLGTFGDISCFSFFSNKNISTGEGGMFVTNNEDYYKKAKLLRSHGMTTLSYERSKGHSTSYDVVELGYNYRMDDIRASLGVVQLKKLNDDLKKREKIRKLYIDNFINFNDVIIPFVNNSSFVSNYIMTIVLKESNYLKRYYLRDFLHQNGVQTSVHYPAVHKFSIYKKDDCILPITEYVADNLISLPMYGSLSESQVTYICDLVKQGLNEYNNFNR